MHAFLYLSPSSQTPLSLIQAYSLACPFPHPDIYTIDPDTPSIKIASIRTAQTFAKTPPLSLTHKLVLLPNAHRLTLPAQHALLKFLEEPPTYLRLYLGSHQASVLLPTILSRCQINYQASTEPITINPTIATLYQQLPTTPLAQRLELCRPYLSPKAKAENLLFQFHHLSRQQLHLHPSPTTLKHCQIWLTAATYLRANVSPTSTFATALYQL